MLTVNLAAASYKKIYTKLLQLFINKDVNIP